MGEAGLVGPALAPRPHTFSPYLNRLQSILLGHVAIGPSPDGILCIEPNRLGGIIIDGTHISQLTFTPWAADRQTLLARLDSIMVVE